jgi:DNA invertase Pin-like site-specific DNA recombinase
VLSQKHEGWEPLPSTYDDGGFSGGNMERPGLNKLLADISAGKIDIVVVYKVDRLTRSLSDFARIVESFDGKDVSFVSVTQQFNTTSSMGRLTLNVLLSFAQFEREVTGERIRDKIAASKKKGMWMGGQVPLGYDLSGELLNRKLIVNEHEVVTVRTIFARYLELKTVTDLQIPESGVNSELPWQGRGLGEVSCVEVRSPANHRNVSESSGRTIVYRSIDTLSPHERNSRTHSKQQIRKLKESIKTFGFTNPILINAEGTIVAGHGRVQAAKLLKMSMFPQSASRT